MEKIIKSILREFVELQEKKSEVEESGLSRLYSHVQKYDCATITSFRNKLVNCIGDSSGEDMNYKSNNKRNKELKSTLLSLGYEVTDVKGTTIENYLQSNAVEVKENTFFVVNSKNLPNFFKNIMNLGEVYCQDSVLLIPKGGKEPFLVGTNKAPFPGYGNIEKLGHFKAGIEGEFMTKVKGRAIMFETFDGLQINTKRLVKEYAKPIMRRLNHGK